LAAIDGLDEELGEINQMENDASPSVVLGGEVGVILR
jgi:hypothetical protein